MHCPDLTLRIIVADSSDNNGLPGEVIANHTGKAAGLCCFMLMFCLPTAAGTVCTLVAAADCRPIIGVAILCIVVLFKAVSIHWSRYLTGFILAEKLPAQIAASFTSMACHIENILDPLQWTQKWPSSCAIKDRCETQHQHAV